MPIDMDALAEAHYADRDPAFQDDEEKLDEQFEDWQNNFCSSDYSDVLDCAKTTTLSINNLFVYIRDHYPNDKEMNCMIKNVSHNFSVMKGDMKI